MVFREAPRITSPWETCRGKGAAEDRRWAIYDVSKIFIRRSLTPIFAFHAVHVSLPKLYCRKADFTRTLASLCLSPLPLTLLRKVTRRSNTLGRLNTRMSLERSRDERSLLSLATPHLELTSGNVCNYSQYTVYAVNACIFLN